MDQAVTLPSRGREPTPLDAPAAFDLHGFASALYPFTRSLTGEGVRQTLAAIAAHIPIDVVEVPSGASVLDWTVPDEWQIRSATIKSMDGRTLVDFADNNLHLLSYSSPFSGRISRDDLAKHVHTLPDQPDLIPYRTGYFAGTWGFCLSQNQWDAMRDPYYLVEVDSTLAPGHMTYGEFFLPGDTADEVLISVHICHPSLANDNLSGIAVATGLALREATRPSRRFGLRILFLPATIGAITWLDRNEGSVDRVRHGLVLSCLGDAGPFHYKMSRSPSDTDRIAGHVLRHSGLDHVALPFTPYGYDERQFCSPGFDMPVGRLTRGVAGEFPEYHTSADNLSFITGAALEQSLDLLQSIVAGFEANRLLRRKDGRGEPQLGRRGLYRAIAGQQNAGGADQLDLLWLLNLADGRHDLVAIADRANVPLARIAAAAELCLQADLVEAIQ